MKKIRFYLNNNMRIFERVLINKLREFKVNAKSNYVTANPFAKNYFD